MINHGESHAQLESTQTELKNRFKSNPSLENGFYIMADRQSSGRGRSDHGWISLSGNLHCSILIKKMPFSELTWVPLWVSVCVHQALVKQGIEPSMIQLKWPNDLWIEHSKKIGGILCEKVGDVIFAGIGLNLVNCPIEVENAGSVFEGLGQKKNMKFDRQILIHQMIELFLIPTTVENVRSYFEQHSLFVAGDLIEWKQNDQTLSGKFLALGVHGEMLVQVGQEKRALFSEEVSRVRVNITI